MKRLSALALAAVAALLLAPPSGSAQGSMVRGMIVDEEGHPVKDVDVTLEFKGETRGRRTWTQKTDKKGGFVRVGLPSGQYEIKFTKESYIDYGIEIYLSLGGLSEICSNAPGPGEPCEEIVLKKAPVVVSIPGGGAEGTGVVETTADEAAQLGATYAAAVEAIKSQDWEAAETALKEVLNQVPDQPVVHLNLGHVYRQKKDLSAAEAEFRRSMELDPTSPEPLIALAALREAQGKEQEAIDLLMEAAPRFEEDAAFQTALGATAMNAGREKDAQAAFTKVVALDPAKVQVRYYLATLALNAGRKEEAVGHLEAFVAGSDPGAPDLEVAKALLEALKKQ